MKTYVEKLLDTADVRPERAHGVIVVGPRALPGELDERERASIARIQAGDDDELPLPFYEDYENGVLEFTPADLRRLAQLGITREEYEILILEDRLKRMEKTK